MNVRASEPASSSKLEEWAHVAALTGKCVVTFISVAYVLGLLIINFHFSALGITDMSLLRVNYILAGTWSLIPILITILIIAVSYSLLMPIWSNGKVIKIVSIFISLALAIVYLTIAVFTVKKFLDVSTNNAFAIFGFPIMGVVCCLPSMGLLKLEHKLDSKEIKRSKKIAATCFMVILALILILHYTFIFAGSIYPSIPSCLGGGNSVPVEMYVDEYSTANESFKNCQIASGKGDSWKAQLVLATDKGYVLLVGNHKEILWIKRDEVKAVRYGVTRSANADKDGKHCGPGDVPNGNAPGIEKERYLAEPNEPTAKSTYRLVTY